MNSSEIARRVRKIIEDENTEYNFVTVRKLLQDIPILLFEIDSLAGILLSVAILLKDAHARTLNLEEALEVIEKAESIARHGSERNTHEQPLA